MQYIDKEGKRHDIPLYGGVSIEPYPLNKKTISGLSNNSYAFKIGRMIFIQVALIPSGGTVPNGSVILTGLPAVSQQCTDDRVFSVITIGGSEYPVRVRIYQGELTVQADLKKTTSTYGGQIIMFVD